MLLHFSLRPVYRQFSQIVAPVVDVGSLYANTFGFKYLWFNYDTKGISKERLDSKTTWKLKRIFCCFKQLLITSRVVESFRFENLINEY